ncbi:copper homeostasis periplasmic binding protein CopC [Pantoea endophytica]|uniref:copper homeostasis periplasmic binding protein CopC n=1 Tax=Pantoea endophytica TaxID=92488 RepID=UPI0024139F5C|nr:copper homeostasis periplasmic binding protein CopC [Pantoea endophytica]
MKKTAFNSVVALLLASSTLAFSQFAMAHAHLKTAVPADKMVVDSFLHNLGLTFTEDVEPAFSGIEVLNAQHQPVAVGKAQFSGEQHNKLVVQFDPPLQSGSYQVNWHVLSVDGHKTKGSYTFSVK